MLPIPSRSPEPFYTLGEIWTTAVVTSETRRRAGIEMSPEVGAGHKRPSKRAWPRVRSSDNMGHEEKLPSESGEAKLDWDFMSER